MRRLDSEGRAWRLSNQGWEGAELPPAEQGSQLRNIFPLGYEALAKLRSAQINSGLLATSHLTL